MPFLAPVAATGLSALIGGLTGKKDNKTSTNAGTSAQTSSSTGTTANTGSTETNKVLTPYQNAFQQPLSTMLMKAFSDPSGMVAPMQHQAREQVNDNYSGVNDKLRTQAYGNGSEGQSGKFGTAQVQTDLARRNALSDVDNQASVTASQIPFTAAQLAEQFLGMNFGSKTDTSGSSTTTQDSKQTGESTGNYTGPGSPATGAAAGAFGAATAPNGLFDALNAYFNKDKFGGISAGNMQAGVGGL